MAKNKSFQEKAQAMSREWRDLFSAIGQVAKDYAMEPLELAQRLANYGESDERMLIGGVAYPKEAPKLARDLASELAGAGGLAAQLGTPPGAIGTFGGKSAYGANRARMEAVDNISAGKTTKEAAMGILEDLKKEMVKTPGGRHSMNLDRAMRRAEELAGPGGEIDFDIAETIRKETGWFKPQWYTRSLDVEPFDQGWRFEISDEDFMLNANRNFKQAQEEIKMDPSFRPQPGRKGVDTKEIKLGDAVFHRELFKAYPELKDVKLQMAHSDAIGGASGQFDPQSGEIIVAADMEVPEIEETLLHEIQHWVQNKEAHARGSNPDKAGRLLQELRIRHNAKAQQLDNVRKMKQDPEIYNHPAFSELRKYADNPEMERILEREKENLRRQMEEADIPMQAYRMSPGEQEARDTVLRFRLYKMQKDLGAENPDIKEPSPYGMVIIEKEKDYDALIPDWDKIRSIRHIPARKAGKHPSDVGDIEERYFSRGGKIIWTNRISP